MIKMSLRQAIAAYQALDEFPRVPDLKISYELGYITDKLEQRVRLYEKERIKLLKANSVVGEDGVRKVDPAKADGVTEELEKMLDEIEITIERKPIKLDAIIGSDPTKQPQVQPALLKKLQGIIIE